MKRKSIRRETLKEDKNNAIVSKLLGTSPANINIEKLREYITRFVNKKGKFAIRGKVTMDELKYLACKFSPEIIFSLNLSAQRIEDVGDIVQCINLSYLDLQENQIYSISPLRVCTRLKILNVTNNLISSLEGISDLTELNFLRIAGNNLKTQILLKPLSNLPALRSLYLQSPDYTNSNPVCKEANYRRNTFELVRSLERLDGTPKSFVDPYEELAVMFEGQSNELDFSQGDNVEWFTSGWPLVQKSREVFDLEKGLNKSLENNKGMVSQIEVLLARLN